MKMDRILPFAKTLLEKAVKTGDSVIDATIGNGHDTLFLAELVGWSGRVYGFDVQEEAARATEDLIRSRGVFNRVTLFLDGHEEILKRIPEGEHGKITGAIFNLGYLPGSDKTVITKPETTIAAVEQCLQIMAPEGIIVMVIYYGHPGGADERDQLLEYCCKLDQNVAHVIQYQFINQRNNPPFIIAIEKR